jgi:hypothetical protein
VWQIEKEGLIGFGIRLDELDRLVGITPSHRPLVDRNLDDFFILHQRSLPLGKR